ncbi:MAG: hypothetical protein HW416_3718 [Chloroflexi bacterium]|nr:hypothetical protein [Chloroflexota bacterium]
MRMFSSQVAFAVATFSSLAACSYAEDIPTTAHSFEAILAGDRVVPPVATAASGSATFEVNARGTAVH